MPGGRLTNTPTAELAGALWERLMLRAVRPVLGALPESTLLRVRSGPLRGALWAPRAFGPRCWLGTYELDKQHWFVEHARPGKALFDIGAHAGFYTLLGARLVGPEGRVFAFEPLPRNLKFLRRHLDANQARNVTVIDAAVGDVPGEARFNSSAADDEGGLSDSGELVVKVVAIDDLVGRGDLPAPSVMKIDVEGAEELVLRGARRTIRDHRPVIMLATHSPDIFDRCGAVLREAGYDLHGPAFERPAHDEVLALPAPR